MCMVFLFLKKFRLFSTTTSVCLCVYVSASFIRPLILDSCVLIFIIYLVRRLHILYLISYAREGKRLSSRVREKSCIVVIDAMYLFIVDIDCLPAACCLLCQVSFSF